MESNENHEKIVNVIRKEGPRLPVQIARELGMNSLFISAFLSELVNSKRIKVSHLKVGGSPLYFLEGQEEQLEPYHKYLHPRESDAFLLLKKENVLRDSEQEPSIRVALRSIRDFAVGFKKDDEIYWKYFSISEEEVRDILEPKRRIIEPEIEIEEEDDLEIGEKVKVRIKGREVKKDFKKKTKENEFKNPLIIKKEEKIKKEKEKSEFILKVVEFIENKGLKIIEEKDFKAKEYNCLVRIDSDLGMIDFLVQAKDKKTISEGDLRKLLSNSQEIPLPALMLYSGDISKKGIEFVGKYNSVLKVEKVN